MAFGQFEMGVGGGDDAEGVGGGEGVVEGGESRDVVFLGDFRGLLWRKIMHAGEVDLSGRGQLGINAGVFLAQGADPEHRDFKF